jgi:hypothetical protein
MIFVKNQERVLLCPIVQTHHGSNEIDRICTKFKKCLRRSARQNESSYAYLRRSNIYVLSCLQLSIGHFGSCLTKKRDFSTLKMENAPFVDETENALCGAPCRPKGHTHVPYRLVPTNYTMARPETRSFDLKAIQPRTR